MFIPLKPNCFCSRFHVYQRIAVQSRSSQIFCPLRQNTELPSSAPIPKALEVIYQIPGILIPPASTPALLTWARGVCCFHYHVGYLENLENTERGRGSLTLESWRCDDAAFFFCRNITPTGWRATVQTCFSTFSVFLWCGNSFHLAATKRTKLQRLCVSIREGARTEKKSWRFSA